MSDSVPAPVPSSPTVTTTITPDTAGIIVIGDEILSGKTVDTNCSFLIGELRALGVALRQVVIIPDVLDEIASHVRDFSARYTHVFTSGGVGPTHDDVTMEGIARGFGTRVIRHPRLEKLLREAYGANLEERNLRMADVPEGVTLVDAGGLTWPVPAYRNVYILPGVPEIFRRKWSAIRERFRTTPYHLSIVYTSDDEGQIAHHLDAIVAAFPRVSVGSYPRIASDGWHVKITLESKHPADVRSATDALLALLPPSSITNVESPGPA